jgi:hypothetical protein
VDVLAHGVGDAAEDDELIGLLQSKGMVYHAGLRRKRAGVSGVRDAFNEGAAKHHGGHVRRGAGSIHNTRAADHNGLLGAERQRTGEDE